ncbi:MAG: hypothetical protein NVSMB9_31260 [Isosphaeraceae bacterium]
MNSPQGPQRSPIPGRAVVFDRPAAERIVNVVKRVEGNYRYSRPPGTTPPRGALNTGMYAYVASNITAASGATLGQGTGVLCSRSGATLTANGETVTIYTAGGAITGPLYLSIAYVQGDWSTSVGPCQ